MHTIHIEYIHICLYVHDVCMNLLYQDTRDRIRDTSINRTLSSVSNATCVYLKCGHLTIQDTLICPNSVLIRDVPLYVHVFSLSIKILYIYTYTYIHTLIYIHTYIHIHMIKNTGVLQ